MLRTVLRTEIRQGQANDGAKDGEREDGKGKNKY